MSCENKVGHQDFCFSPGDTGRKVILDWEAPNEEGDLEPMIMTGYSFTLEYQQGDDLIVITASIVDNRTTFLIPDDATFNTLPYIIRWIIDGDKTTKLTGNISLSGCCG